ncbi:Uncharacterised protein [Legionella donaldsonii]|uniref:Uncharacterized protein n=1 Tax=Legionella donaldsonii TaxID=45060 RepID=A0A378JAQ7_9GAMM|nr:hypothetical protein [Legionella donaldsonii]STX44228.1 Uncharacterised protein [Legionella donaldsonii]
MKNNDKSVAAHVLEIINELFKQNGKKNIPDVKEICSKAKINRDAAIKHLYEWWEQQQDSELRRDILSPSLTELSPDGNKLQQAIISLQCLAKELEIYSDSLNHLSNQTIPLGNYILHSLQEIENKLFVTDSYVHELTHDKTQLEKDLHQTLNENSRLVEEIGEMQHIFLRRQEQLQDQLDAKKREVLAANHLIKSLKREKRRPTLKRVFYDYHLIMKNK